MVKQTVWNLPHFNIAFMSKSLSTYVVSTNVAGLGTIYNVNAGDDYIKYSVALVRERTIPTERPPPVDEVSANFCG